MKLNLNIDLKDKKTIALLIASATLILIAIALAIYYILTPIQTVEIPNFSQLSTEEISEWSKENKLTEDQIVILEEFDETVEEGSLISQSLGEGTSLSKDDVLTLIYSKGPDPKKIIEIPDFTGEKEKEIASWFEENKFSDVSFEYIPDEKIEEGFFIKSNLSEPSVSRDTVILISISVGSESTGVDIIVPDFSGYTVDNIKAWGKTNNITITFKTTTSSTIEKNGVISQSVEAGKTMQTGGKLTITLSLGKGVTAIDLSGKTKTQVETWIKENKLKVSFAYYYNDTVKKNMVISNKPKSGAVSEGSSITVNISMGQPLIENYTGKTKSEMEAYIKKVNSNYNGSAKLVLKVIEVESSESSGKIIEQLINNKVVTSSTQVSIGTTITIKVAKEKSINVENKVGETESYFKTYIEGLGLKLGTKSSRYSLTIGSGKIMEHDKGSKTAGSSINYIVSMGAYSPSANSFNGKSKSSIESTIKAANNQGAGWTTNLQYSQTYTSDIDKDIAFDCSVDSKTKVLSCTISPGKYIVVENKSGTTESSFKSYIEGLGLKLGFRSTTYHDSIPAGSIILHATGKFTPGQTIDYTVSNGKEPEIEKKTVPNYSLTLLKGSNYDASVSNVRSAFEGFTNLVFVPVATDDDGQPDGLIESISVSPGSVIPINQEIIIKIIKK